MTFEEYDRGVRGQIQARKPAKQPDDLAIQTAVTFYKELGAIRADTMPQCAALAIVIARAYQRGQHTAQETAPPPEARGVINLKPQIDALVTQAREELVGVSGGEPWTPEAVQAYLASPSAGDTLLPFCRDVASATKTTELDVGMAVLAHQPLTLSAGNFGTVTYSIAMPRSRTGMIQWPTLEGQTGNILQHTWESWLPEFRHIAGHKPRQRIQTEEAQEQKRALQAFVEAQKQVLEWTHGDAPRGFWPSTFRAWNEQCEQSGHTEWQYESREALRKAYDRLPDNQG